MIKYLGSKRRLVPVLGELFERSGATTGLDLFTGTTRVAQEWKRRGGRVTTVDLARYSEVLSRCYVQTDASEIDLPALERAIAELQQLRGVEGYVTETFSRKARYFQEFNAEKIDAVRDAIEDRFTGHPWHPLLLTSLIEAADRVDSTTGVQMAFLKTWSERSHHPLTLRVPHLLEGRGTSLLGDACEVVSKVPDVDIAYLDPPYNQHRYAGNYHVWETLVAWDSPEHYGVACKRADLRSPAATSVFNRRRDSPQAMTNLVRSVRAEVVVMSGSDEGWITVEQLAELASERGDAIVLSFDSKRYVGAQIGIHDRHGRKVGRVGRTRNTEYLVLGGPPDVLARMSQGYPVRSSLAPRSVEG